MEIHKYNRLKAASKRVQSEVSFDSAEWEQARPQVKIVLAEKERTGTWFSEQMGHNVSTVSRWMTNKYRTALQDCTPPRRGCKGIIGVFEVTRLYLFVVRYGYYYKL